MAQTQYLDWVASQEIPQVEITALELEEKEIFREKLEGILKAAVAESPFGGLLTIELVGFGSLASSFAMPDSDMDLALVPIRRDGLAQSSTEIPKEIPRLLEKAVLDANMGGRLLTRTRVPILKVCQAPTEALYIALSDERKKWDDLPEEEKYTDSPRRSQPHESQVPIGQDSDAANLPDTQDPIDSTAKIDAVKSSGALSKSDPRDLTPSDAVEPNAPSEKASKPKTDRHQRVWHREKVLGPLDFPKTGVGIQCDINFSNPLGINNTHLLRCYSRCDPRVRPMVLFVKAWAKRRKINNSYSGTLSSYGWVLMVLHYLVNVAQPAVCPNLQLSSHRNQSPQDLQTLERYCEETIIDGYHVNFWRNEGEIMREAQMNRLTANRQSVGALLRGFFQYYAGLSRENTLPFHWTQEVISLRTKGGLRTKVEKEWTGAKTTLKDGKEVRQRYLFAIEDPFEIDHNVARTVTHNGIVAIRDEFRRAWRILSAVSRNAQPEGGLFDEVIEDPPVSSKVNSGETGVERKEATNESNAFKTPTGPSSPSPRGFPRATNPGPRNFFPKAMQTKPQSEPDPQLPFHPANKDVDFPPLG